MTEAEIMKEAIQEAPTGKMIEGYIIIKRMKMM